MKNPMDVEVRMTNIFEKYQQEIQNGKEKKRKIRTRAAGQFLLRISCRP